MWDKEQETNGKNSQNFGSEWALALKDPSFRKEKVLKGHYNEPL